ncbi:hypothetical protein ACJMK2_008083 [Sinanodonta woodiana]|uniref:Uncharacterized protein n=1 Tax=Sinanodonta woodiana TaxID=1069815 RepID=A0ABD3VKH2_SINWO
MKLLTILFFVLLSNCEDPTCGVSVPVVVIIAILMILLGIVGMLIFTCLTYEIWRSWKICGPFHSCLSHDTYVDPVLKKSHTAGKAAHTNITVNNSTYQDSGMANHSVEPCIYDSPRDSIQADTIYNPASSVGTQENTNIVLEKHEGIKDSIHIHPSQYEILNESGNEDEREHRYSSIHSEPRDSSELTSESGSASRPNTEYQKVERNHVYFQVEKHSKVTTSGS